MSTDATTCATGKRRFPSREQARRGMRRLSDRLTLYRCPDCHGWHLSNTDRRGQR